MGARRLEFGTTPVGVVVIGFKLDDRMVDSIRRQAASLIAIEFDRKLVAVSALETGETIDRTVLGAALVAVPTSSDPSAAPTEITVGEDRYLALAAPLSGYSGTSSIRFFVVRSLERTIAPARSVAAVVLRIGAVGLTVAILVAVLLAGGLSRPIDGLVGVVKEITAGRLDTRAEVKGPVEIRELAHAMNRMVSELGESRRHMTAKERLEKEMEISSRIQTSIMPRRVDVEGLDIAARMIPATEGEPVERIRDKILDEVAAFSPHQDDDITLLVIRYIAPKERLA